MEEHELKAVASQLSCPQGDAGIEMGNKMNSLNEFITQQTIKTLSPKQDEVIAELGPGNGALSESLVEILGSNGKYYGIEPSDVMANEARKLLSGYACAVKIFEGDHLSIDIPANSLDGLFAVNVLYFIEDLDQFLRRIMGWMKSGSRVVFGVRSDHALKNLPFIDYGFNVRSPEEIKDYMRNNGFSHVDSFYHDEGTVLLGDQPLIVDSVIIKGSL